MRFVLLSLLLACVHHPSSIASDNAEIATTDELSGPRPPSCATFDLDLSAMTFPTADGHGLWDRRPGCPGGQSHVYLMEMNGARHEIECLMKPDCTPAPLNEGGDEVCVDYTKCRDAGLR